MQLSVLRSFLFLMILAGAHTVFSQTTRVSGKVSDAVTKVPIPFVNVLFKGTIIGTMTDENGNFSMETKLNPDTIIVSAVGFRRRYVRIKPRENNKSDILLEPDNVNLTEVIVKYQGNPAERLMKKVIDHKPENDPENLKSYKYEVYNKLEVDVYNISKLMKNNFIVKPFNFMFRYTDTTGNNGVEYLPSFITETISDRYYQKLPQITKEVIKASKVAGSENENVSQFTGDMYQNINIYRNFLVIANKSFVSPVAASGIFFYRYYLADSTFRDGHWCYKIDYYPRRTQDYTFNGHLWIHDTTFAVQSLKAQLSENVNMNFIKKLDASQEYRFEQNRWVLGTEKVMVDLKPLTKNSISIIGRKSSVYSNHTFNEPIPDSVIRNLNSIIVLEKAVSKPDSFWIKARPDSLNIRERGIYKMVDSIKSNKTYKLYFALGNFFTTGYLPVGPVEFGQYYKFFSWNPVEGYRIRFGGRTSNKLSKRWMLEGYAAYGFTDRSVKFRVAGYWHFVKTKNPWRLYGIRYRDDLEQFSVSDRALEHDNILNAILRSRKMNNLLRVRHLETFYEHEWFNGLTNRLTFVHREVIPVGEFRFQRGNDTTQFYNQITTTEFTLSTNFALRQKYIVRRIDRIPTGTRWPIFNLDYTLGIRGLWNATFGYHKLKLRVNDRIRINPLGFTDYMIEGGKIWGAVPWPFLFNHSGNSSWFYDRNAFNLMLPLEFVSDQYAAIFIQHHFDGFFLNKIPLVKKLKWREVVTFNALYGSLVNYAQHKELIRFPQYPQNSQIKPALYQPYYEVGFGIENIFRVFRIDFIWRLSNLNRDVDGNGINEKKISPFGVRGSINFRL